MKNRGLATQLIILILCGSTVIFLAIFAYNYYVSKRNLMFQAQESARSLTQETVYRIEAILRGVEKVPLNLAALMEHTPCNQNDLAKLVKTSVEHNREIYGVGIAFEPYTFDARHYYFMPYCFRDRDLLKTIWLGSESYRYFFLDWYQIPRELGQPVWSEPYFDEGAGNILMSTFSVPLYREVNGTRQLQGIIGADISLMWLKEMVSQVRIFQSGYAFLISQNGVFVTHPNPRVIMRETIFSVAEEENRPGLKEIGRQMIRGREGFVQGTDFSTGKRVRFYFAPVPSSHWSLGVVFPEDELFAGVHSLLQRTVLMAVLGLIFLSLLIVGVSRRMTRPLRTLAGKTEDIAHGDFAARVPETGAKEVANLARSFNRMGEQLVDYIEKRDFIRDTFGRYVTQDVVKRLLESREALELGGETREVTILMSDLRGFTALTAEMDPEDVITFLNRYLGRMIEVLIDYRATIDEIIGDGILAFFGAPEHLEDHPARAVACALAMQGAMEEINARNAEDGLPHLEMGIAVNTGAVVVGNIGSEKRTKYSVVGAHVNFTARIESYAVGGQVLISPATYARVQDLVEVGGELQAQMKGVPGTTTIYEIRGISGPYNLRLPERAAAMVVLPHSFKVQIQRISSDKIITGAAFEARITHLGETSALLVHEGELAPWEDVRLTLLDEQGAALPGKAYAKVAAIGTTEEGQQQATLYFTSISPEISGVIRKVIGEGGPGQPDKS